MLTCVKEYYHWRNRVCEKTIGEYNRNLSRFEHNGQLPVPALL